MKPVCTQNKTAPPSPPIIGALLAPIAIFAFVFIVAGRIDYWQGWVYTVLTCLIFLVTYFFLKDNRNLMTERLKPGKGIKWWDKIYFYVTTSLGFLTIILAALDTGRFDWSKPIYWSSYLAGYVLFITGHVVFLSAKRTNRFFSSVVRIQIVLFTVLFSAGRLTWSWAWIYLGTYIAIIIVNAFVLPADLIKERGKSKENVKKWDKVIMTLKI